MALMKKNGENKFEEKREDIRLCFYKNKNKKFA